MGVGLLFLFTSCFGRVGTGEGWEKQNTTIFSRKNSFFAFSVFPTLAPPRTMEAFLADFETRDWWSLRVSKEVAEAMEHSSSSPHVHFALTVPIDN